MRTNHSTFQPEVLLSLLWHVHKRFTQFSNMSVCGLFDDNFCEMLTKSNMMISNEPF